MYVLAPPAVVHRATHDNHRHHGRLRLRLADAGVCEIVVVELPPLHQQAAVGRHCMYVRKYVCKLVIDTQTHTPRQTKQHREEYTQSTHDINVYDT